jgi:thiol:disulfide interchange protein
MKSRIFIHRWLATLLVAAACAGCASESVETPVAATDVAVEAAIARGRIPFVESFEQGRDLALASGKPLLVFFTAGWCDFCHAMANDAFCQDSVVDAADQFVCVLIDADREPELCQHFQVRSYPTIQFVSPEGVVLNRVIGKKPSHELVMEMQAVLQTVARRIVEPASQLR